MKVKRFSAQNMQTALRLVSQELGEDAVIISTQKGTAGIEVVAAIDYQPHHTQADIDRQLRLQDELERARTDLQQRGRDQRLVAAQQADVSSHAGLVAALNKLKQPVAEVATVAEPAEPNALQLMQSELQELKQLLLSSIQPQVSRSGPSLSMQLQARGQDFGLDSQLTEHLLTHIQADDADAAWQQVLLWLEQNLPVAQHNCLEKGGVLALVGPTGAGKTTTIGKMAAQAVLRHGADQVALVTLDNYRVAAHDQLRSFARILGVPLKIVAPAGDLTAALAELSDKKMVFIDTAGLSKNDPHFATQLALLRKTGLRVRKLLVMPLTSHARSLQENYRQFKLVGLAGCVFTKLDECFSLGGAVSLAIRGQLPVHFVTNGPHIPQNIQRPDAKKIIKLAQRMTNNTYTKIRTDMQMPTMAMH